MKRLILIIAAILALPPAARADSPPAIIITVESPYAYATAPAQTNGAVFFQTVNSGAVPDRLIGAHTGAAEKSELHTHIMEGDTMMMREVDGYDLPAGETLKLEPMGHHIMLMGLKKPLEEGQVFDLTLDFEHSPDQTIEVRIVPPGAAPEQSQTQE